MNINSKLQQQLLLNKKLQRLLESSTQEILNLKTTTDSAVKTASSALQAADDSIKSTALTSGLAGKANLVHTHSASDITSGLAAVATTGTYSSLSGTPTLGSLASITVTGTPSSSTYLRGDNAWTTLPYPAQTSSQSFISANVSLTNQSQWYTVTSLTLAAGTWLVMATATFARGGSGARAFSVRIASSSTHYASAQQGLAGVSGNAVETSCSAIITLASSTTINMQGATNTTSSPADYAAYTESIMGTTNASGLVAVRIA